MKIDKLKRIAKENDYGYFGITSGFFDFRRESDGALISISISEVNNISFLDLDSCDEKDLNMIKAAIEFAETPPDDREEEKKFYLKNRWENKQLTLKEIEAIKEKFNTDLTDFVLVEVEDVD